MEPKLKGPLYHRTVTTQFSSQEARGESPPPPAINVIISLHRTRGLVFKTQGNKFDLIRELNFGGLAVWRQFRKFRNYHDYPCQRRRKIAAQNRCNGVYLQSYKIEGREKFLFFKLNERMVKFKRSKF